MRAQERINAACSQRGLPKILLGYRCEVDGKEGLIVDGNSSANFNVLFDSEPHVKNCHPGWRMTILNFSGDVVYKGESN